jgi:hypothetical protein
MHMHRRIQVVVVAKLQRFVVQPVRGFRLESNRTRDIHDDTLYLRRAGVFLRPLSSLAALLALTVCVQNYETLLRME